MQEAVHGSETMAEVIKWNWYEGQQKFEVNFLIKEIYVEFM